MGSPILRIQRGEPMGDSRRPTHVHAGPVLLSSQSATLLGTAGPRDWLIPPGHGLWVPGNVEHGGTVLRDGELSIIHFAPSGGPVVWDEPTGFAIGPLLRELIRHLRDSGPYPLAEALMVDLLEPLAPHDVQVSLPTDPRVRLIAEKILADPSDQRELAAWADHVHAGTRTLSRLFRTETGLSFAAWRTRVRIRAAIHLLGDGRPVGTIAHAVGYHSPSAFITAFRRVTGQTPGTYLSGTAPDSAR